MHVCYMRYIMMNNTVAREWREWPMQSSMEGGEGKGEERRETRKPQQPGPGRDAGAVHAGSATVEATVAQPFWQCNVPVHVQQ
jgi:hypothetical protein